MIPVHSFFSVTSVSLHTSVCEGPRGRYCRRSRRTLLGAPPSVGSQSPMRLLAPLPASGAPPSVDGFLQRRCCYCYGHAVRRRFPFNAKVRQALQTVGAFTAILGPVRAGGAPSLGAFLPSGDTQGTPDRRSFPLCAVRSLVPLTILPGGRLFRRRSPFKH